MDYYRYSLISIGLLSLFLIMFKGLFEPLFIMIFQKLPFNHLYLFPKKLTDAEAKILDENY